MKSIGIVTNYNSSLATSMRENLDRIFSGYVQYNNYYLREMDKGRQLSDDCILLMTQSTAVKLHGNVADKKRLIVVERTVKESELYKIAAIPENTTVLVVNDQYATTLETVALLYRLGLNHLQLIPCEEGKEYKNCSIAITPGERHRVPEYIETVIDIGNRCIDLSTFIQIMNQLSLDTPEIHRRLIKYSEDIATPDTGLKKQHQDLFQKNLELNTVINASKEGVLLLNRHQEIVLYNKSLAKMLEINDDVVGRTLENVIPPTLAKKLLDGKTINEAVEHNEKTLVVNRQDIFYFGQNAGTCFNLQEITHIKQLEYALSKRTVEKGLVARYSFSDLITRSPKMLECISLAEKMAKTDLTVLITGESGTGKELVAQSIHSASNRAKYPFIAINCAAVPENLLESELFGYESGAFTGARREGKAGLFEQANCGTIFLDEVGDMPLSLQARLLRVIQERQVMRVGSSKVLNVDIRIIAATNKNLSAACKMGRFREDLYYRLNVLPLAIPALRERQEDILLLLAHFGGKNVIVDDEVKQMLEDYYWPGNIREVQNVASYLSFVVEGEVSADKLPHYIQTNLYNYDNEYNYIRGKTDIRKVTSILRILARKDKPCETGIGRKYLEAELRLEGKVMTEGEIRSALQLLNRSGLIVSRTGRQGSVITARGRSFLQWEKQRGASYLPDKQVE